jgi:hypothetical protein
LAGAYQVISTMGDRFALVRLSSDDDQRRAAGLQAMRNVNHESKMRAELAELVGGLLADAADVVPDLDDQELGDLLGLADLVTRGRTPVERDHQGNPLFAHALEMPTRYAKQLVQLVRGGLALGIDRKAALGLAARCTADTLPPLRLRVLGDVAEHPESRTADVVTRLQLPRNTVDRTLQELHLLGLLQMHEVSMDQRTRWIFSLASGVDRESLSRLVAGGLKSGAGARP